ncbi:transporter [Saccharomycopsis crataegensis]|uniref:Transporter n=1 Tax=Saccharomycopsis crataegensis TaxID=43959 RepID=A0AAV5QPL6_9ASCO|nr:transporter [Saccharomycopsis crataegensis]
MYNPNNYNSYGNPNASNLQQPNAGGDINFYQSQYPTSAAAPANISGGPPFFENLSGNMDNQYLSNPSFTAGGDGSDSQLPRGILAAFSTSGYPGEPSLLEELDINFDHIKVKTLAVLNPFGSKISNYNNGLPGQSANILNDADLAGPIFFALLYGVSLLLAGKVHFGYIYGCGLFGTLSLFALFKLMSNNDVPTLNANQPNVASTGSMQGVDSGAPDTSKTQDLNYSRTTSVLGYCLLPLVLLSFLGIVFTLDNFWGYLLSLICALWSTYSASGFFVLVLKLQNSRFLVAYPLLLFYSIFALMAIFVEKA